MTNSGADRVLALQPDIALPQGGSTPVDPIVAPRNNPRHPCPDLRDEFTPRGWVFFRTDAPCGPPTFHAVFCCPVPARCARFLAFREHAKGPPALLRLLVRERADVIEAHAMACTRCVFVLATAKRDAVLAR
ncbi:hypothetical protein O4J56_21090 [Nocardiopsis sp. RSe5-2]|uniref:Uncharacterized protein n=1 Tax=Nocardiopsis endophytica TaxID=3018445 RepID=A0ABT4U9T9_9ACTN|nr:hypothetical protein [Nocardiopsis endophytica]MDA2813155.1 hypothetical protein [Nocardiopsis endophytica]